MMLDHPPETAGMVPWVVMYGGTFDPIHNGHLRSAVELEQWLPLKALHLVPCALPPHRAEPGATPEQRLAMLRTAAKGMPSWVIDDRELRRDGPSYSLDTLMALREQYGHDQPLAFMMGWDAFAGLSSWSRWEALFDVAHIIVLDRPGERASLPEVLTQTLAERSWTKPLSSWPTHGGILPLALPSALTISATYIRRQLQTSRSVRYLLPDQVIDYIQQHQLYR
ncbi:nicotinate-nucleotide adenylyltransferase [Terasakiispira papahanaumokuakeensis]|nr:nicotinate-nucleotide adenylyltransferase [Terasakiispira papahanaumokuakeensis]